MRIFDALKGGKEKTNAKTSILYGRTASAIYAAGGYIRMGKDMDFAERIFKNRTFAKKMDPEKKYISILVSQNSEKDRALILRRWGNSIA